MGGNWLHTRSIAAQNVWTVSYCIDTIEADFEQSSRWRVTLARASMQASVKRVCLFVDPNLRYSLSSRLSHFDSTAHIYLPCRILLLPLYISRSSIPYASQLRAVAFRYSSLFYGVSHHPPLLDTDLFMSPIQRETCHLRKACRARGATVHRSIPAYCTYIGLYSYSAFRQYILQDTNAIFGKARTGRMQSEQTNAVQLQTSN
jgi:hypothetical protein